MGILGTLSLFICPVMIVMIMIALQVSSDAILNIFLCDGWLQLLAEREACSAQISSVCTSVLSATGSWHSLCVSWKCSEMKPIADAISAVRAMAMCFLILLGENLPELYSEGSPTNHVFQLTEYKGKDVFRRSIRTVLQKEVWATEVVALTVTAGSAALLRPKLERLSSVLKDALTWTDDRLSAISPDLVQEVADLFNELKVGIREVEFRVLKQQVAALCCNVAKAFLKGDCPKGGGKTVDTVWQILTDVSDLPGVLSVLGDFKKWATSVKSQKNMQELLEYWTNTSTDNLDFGKMMEILPETVPILDSASRATFRDAGSQYLLCALQHIVDQVGIVRGPYSDFACVAFQHRRKFLEPLRHGL